MQASFNVSYGPGAIPPFVPLYLGDEIPDHPTPKPKKEGDEESKEGEADE